MTDETRAAPRVAGEASAPTAPAADATLDCKGLLCPLPIYKTSQAIAKLERGQVLRVDCTDPGSMQDFPAFARQRGHALVSAEDENGVQVFYLRKEASQ